jgi:1-deoxy-D-xylulose-5-phosphate synthase
VEDNAKKGGFGSGVLELLASRGHSDSIKVKVLGFPDHFIEHGPQETLYKNARIDIPAIIQAVLDLLSDKRK